MASAKFARNFVNLFGDNHVIFLSQDDKALAIWARQFENNELDAVFVLTHAPGSSTYNLVERRVAPLSKVTAGIIFLLIHLVTT